MGYVIREDFPTFMGGEMYDDIFQVGCVGLVKAAQRFDESLGFKFSTYASKYIKGYINVYLRKELHYKKNTSLLNAEYDEDFINTIPDIFIDVERDGECSCMVKYYMDIVDIVKGTPTQKRVYKDYMNLVYYGVSMTMDEFAERHRMTRQRVTQIIEKVNKRVIGYISKGKLSNKKVRVGLY